MGIITLKVPEGVREAVGEIVRDHQCYRSVNHFVLDLVTMAAEEFQVATLRQTKAAQGRAEQAQTKGDDERARKELTDAQTLLALHDQVTTLVEALNASMRTRSQPAKEMVHG